MKLIVFCLAACAGAVPAFAQSANRPDFAIGGSGYVFNQAASASPNLGSHYTPTMRRQELAQAIALREEAAALLLADGGTLNPRNQRYIRRKAAKILSY